MTSQTGLSPYKALHTMENASDFLSANVSWISLGTHKKRLEEGLKGSWTLLFIGQHDFWLVHTNHVTWILASDWSELSWLGNQDGHWLLPPVFILDPIFTRCRHIVIICSFMFYTHPLPCLKPLARDGFLIPDWLSTKVLSFCSLAFTAEDVICSSLIMHCFGITFPF